MTAAYSLQISTEHSDRNTLKVKEWTKIMKNKLDLLINLFYRNPRTKKGKKQKFHTEKEVGSQEEMAIISCTSPAPQIVLNLEANLLQLQRENG